MASLEEKTDRDTNYMVALGEKTDRGTSYIASLEEKTCPGDTRKPRHRDTALNQLRQFPPSKTVSAHTGPYEIEKPEARLLGKN